MPSNLPRAGSQLACPERRIRSSPPHLQSSAVGSPKSSLTHPTLPRVLALAMVPSTRALMLAFQHDYLYKACPAWRSEFPAAVEGHLDDLLQSGVFRESQGELSMASPSEKAREYFDWLLEAKNSARVLERIERDLDQLIYTSSRQKISRVTKLNILDELEQLVRQEPSLEDSNEYVISESIRGTAASNNSDVLDVISAMKRRAG